jgi:micrococcal nuclease
MSMRFIALLAISLGAVSPAGAMEFCAGTKRFTCVVDGDTFWLKGEKIRIMDIDAPEMGGACLEEREKSASAAARLAELLSSGEIELERHGQDFHKRTLAIVIVEGLDVSRVLIDEELALPWSGKREVWCKPPAPKKASKGG